MTSDEIINALEATWEEPDGFFWKLRYGTYERESAEQVLSLLSRLSFPQEEPINRRVVSLLWYIPMFCQWQYERMREDNSEQSRWDRQRLQWFMGSVIGQLERADLLGLP